jgi:peptidoglycan/xylan/chitin deacetylase (PgdA/CDA1 family)
MRHWPRHMAQTHQWVETKSSLVNMGQIIFSLLLLIVLASCGTPPSPPANVTPTARPSPTTLTQVTPTQRITPPPTQTPTPRPTPSPCETPPGVSPVSPAEVDQGNTSKPRIALTFDAGGPADPTSRILDILAKHHNHSTWFITGDWAKENPVLVKRVWHDGHEIGNHTMHHQDLTTLSDTAVCTEFNQAEALISRLTGHTTHPYYRPPYGARNAHVRALAAHLGYRTIYWTIDTLDWKTDATPQKIIDRVMRNVNNGAIILMHAGSTAEVDTLDQLMTLLDEKGYQMVTITQVLG